MVCQSTMRKAPKAPCKTIIKLSGKENVYIESKSVLRKRQGGSLWHRKEPVTEFHRETASLFTLPPPSVTLQVFPLVLSYWKTGEARLRQGSQGSKLQRAVSLIFCK